MHQLYTYYTYMCVRVCTCKVNTYMSYVYLMYCPKTNTKIFCIKYAIYQYKYAGHFADIKNINYLEYLSAFNKLDIVCKYYCHNINLKWNKIQYKSFVAELGFFFNLS